MTLIGLSALLLVLVVGSTSQAQIKFESRWAIADGDSLNLYYRFYPGYVSLKTPTVVTLPMMGHDYLSYTEFRTQLRQYMKPDSVQDIYRMPNIVSPDLRGHGKSWWSPTDSLDYRTMSVGQFAKYPSDVKKIITDLLADEDRYVGDHNLIVMGASIGANTAALLTEILPGIQRLILMSPGLDFRELKPAGALRQYKGKVLILASRGDTYSAESAKTLAEIAPDRFQLHLFDGSRHGTDIIDQIPEAMTMVREWIMDMAVIEHFDIKDAPIDTASADNVPTEQAPNSN
jgi:pimeloyl-ACP methyl ester carboxylesterase